MGSGISHLFPTLGFLGGSHAPLKCSSQWKRESIDENQHNQIINHVIRDHPEWFTLLTLACCLRAPPLANPRKVRGVNHSRSDAARDGQDLGCQRASCAWRTIGSDRRQVDPSHVRASLLGPSPSQPHHPRPADARVRPSQAKVEQEVLAPQVLSRRLELRPWLPPRRSAHAPRRKLCPRHDKGQHGRCSCSTPPAGFVHCSRNGSRRARDIYLAQQGAHASNGGSRAAICARAVARRAHGG